VVPMEGGGGRYGVPQGELLLGLGPCVRGSYYYGLVASGTSVLRFRGNVLLIILLAILSHRLNLTQFPADLFDGAVLESGGRGRSTFPRAGSYTCDGG
jgi:hypothetical protein